MYFRKFFRHLQEIFLSITTFSIFISGKLRRLRFADSIVLHILPNGSYFILDNVLLSDNFLRGLVLFISVLIFSVLISGSYYSLPNVLYFDVLYGGLCSISFACLHRYMPHCVINKVKC
jgi:hypothetical protein